MQCPRCGQDNPPQAKFCLECAAPLAAKCRQCGAELPARAKFCVECAQPVGALAPPSSTLPAPDTYTPPHLAERILTSRAAVEGERKQVTVLFADLKGSMELLADRDPEEARAILDPVLERMMETVHRYEGTVNQVMGDGIMALFGAPLAHEDHAVRACYAALSMQEAIRQYAEEVFRTRGLRPQIRVGLNSGEVVVRSIGSDLRMDYTAVGQTTHLAARMEQTALPGSILMAPATLRLAEGYLQVKALGAVPIKGLEEPVEVYEVLGVGLARSRLQAAAARGLTRFVGRDAEIETLRRALERARAGHGQLVALVGEPGVGKSRVVHELVHSHRVQDWLVLRSGSVSYGKATSYLPVIDLVKSYCQIGARDDTRSIREKLTGKLLALDRALEAHLSAFLALLDVPADDPAWEKLDPPQRRRCTLDAVKRLLLRESQLQPLLLVFEDLHWIDAETQALLDGLVDSLPTSRVLLLVNYRPEYEHAWHRKTYYQQLRLDPLPPESADEFLQALLGDDASLAPLKQLLVGRTEGNPFFLEESVRTLVETGTLAGEQGAYRLAGPLVSTHVPATVQAVLAARIDRLAPEDKRLLQAAAVIGKDIPYPIVLTIGELPENALREGLVRLQAAEFLYEAALFPELEYTFKHALTHEVAYGSLLQARRRATHRQIKEAIEQHYPDRLAEQAEQLARHAFRGEMWEQAVTSSRQCASKAAARSAHRDAVELLEQALIAVARLPESRATLEQAIDVRFQLYRSLLAVGQLPRLRAVLHEVQPLAEELDDPLRLARLYAHMTAYHRSVADYQHCVETGERALAFAAPLEEDTLKAEVSYFMGLASYELGNYTAAIGYFQRSVVQVPGGLHATLGSFATPAVVSRGFLAISHAELGNFAEGILWLEEAQRIAGAGAATWDVMTGWIGETWLCARRGDLGRGIPAGERALSLCESADLAYLYAPAASLLGYLYALGDRVAEAVPLLEQAVERGAAIGQVVGESRFLARLGEAYLLAGQCEQAAQTAERALAMARERQERGNAAMALQLLGEIAAQGEPPDVEQAEAHYRQALVLATELSMRPVMAHCHLGLGTLYGQLRRREQAQAELSTAAGLYRAMDMPFWLAKVETALAQFAS